MLSATNQTKLVTHVPQCTNTKTHYINGFALVTHDAYNIQTVLFLTSYLTIPPMTDIHLIQTVITVLCWNIQSVMLSCRGGILHGKDSPGSSLALLCERGNAVPWSKIKSNVSNKKRKDNELEKYLQQITIELENTPPTSRIFINNLMKARFWRVIYRLWLSTLLQRE